MSAARRIRRQVEREAEARAANQPHLFQFMSRMEFKLCWALAFIESQGREDYAGAIGLDRHATPGEEGPTDDWLEEIKRAVRYLVRDHGFRFRWLEVFDNGEIHGTPVLGERDEAVPPVPQNQYYRLMLSQGQLPSPLDAVRCAIRAAGDGLEDDGQVVRLPSLPLDTLRAVEQDILDALAAQPEMPPEIEAGLELQRDQALASIGVVRAKGPPN